MGVIQFFSSNVGIYSVYNNSTSVYRTQGIKHQPTGVRRLRLLQKDMKKLVTWRGFLISFS